MHIIFNTVEGAYAMGNNKYGQLGLGDYDCRKVPTKLKFPHEIISVHYEKNRTIMNTTDGLYSFGDRNSELGGNYSENMPTKIIFEYEILSVSCGSYHTIINTTNGLYSFGSNYFGQLGVGDFMDRKVPKKINFEHEILSIHCGRVCTIINTTNGLYSFGINYAGQLGIGDNVSRNVPKKINFQYDVLSIICGGSHTIINTTNGLYCFGNNDYGQLGLGDYMNRYMPTKSQFYEIIYSIHCGVLHTVFNTADGLYGCGSNNIKNPLGLRDLKSFNIPTKIDLTNHKLGTTDFEVFDVYCGYRYTMLVLGDRLVTFGGFKIGDNQTLPKVIEFDKELKNYSSFKQKRAKSARFIVTTET